MEGMLEREKIYQNKVKEKLKMLGASLRKGGIGAKRGKLPSGKIYSF